MIDNMNSKKIQWVDWMKVLGMLFIIWGHCFPETMSAFIYAFNVPVFFIIAGFLCKNSASFFPKLWSTLIVPYLLLAYIKGAGAIIKGFSTGEWWQTAGGILLGYHTIGEIQGCSNLWFVYTLILIKLIHFLVRGNLWWMIGFSAISITAATLMNGVVDMPAWAVSDTLIALPFFTIGYLLKTCCKQTINTLVTYIKSHKVLSAITTTVLLIGTWGLANINGAARMFCGEYGESMTLFITGAIAGSTALFVLCAMIDDVKWKYLSLLAIGNLVTLTFHRELLHEPLKWINKSSMEVCLKDASMLAISAVVLLLFIPIIWIIKKYLPILIGKRK